MTEALGLGNGSLPDETAEPGRQVDTEIAATSMAPQVISRSGGLRQRAMIKIQEGCDQVCAYCIVPKVRGRERSIPPDDLVQQIQEGCPKAAKRWC